MKAQHYYGPAGLIGCATPQGNPTVEPEMHRLCPPSVSLLFTRSVAQGDSRRRLVEYFNGLGRTLESFDGLALDAFGFACTASSYLLEPGVERQQLGSLEDRFGHPVITAAGAVEQALRFLGVERIALASPYPAWLHELSCAHWRERGFQVGISLSGAPGMGDTHGVYQLQPAEIVSSIEAELHPFDADVLIMTGTGMPTLPFLSRLREAFRVPVLSSNLCLAWALLQHTSTPAAESNQWLHSGVAVD